MFMHFALKVVTRWRKIGYSSKKTFWPRGFLNFFTSDFNSNIEMLTSDSGES